MYIICELHFEVNLIECFMFNYVRDQEGEKFVRIYYIVEKDGN